MDDLLLMFPGVRSSLVFSGFRLKPPASVFSLILTVASRLLHLYSTNDKTSRLMMKSFSTVRDTQRGTQSYMEKRRRSRDIAMTQRRRGGIKRGESKLASNHFLMCSPQSGPFKMFMQLYREEKREEGDRGGWEYKRGNQKERQIQPVISSLSVLHTPEQKNRFTVLGREEKGRSGI